MLQNTVNGEGECIDSWYMKSTSQNTIDRKAIPVQNMLLLLGFFFFFILQQVLRWNCALEESDSLIITAIHVSKIMFAEWIKFSKSGVWTLNHLMSKLIMTFCRHQDGWLYLPYPISSSVPSGCLYSVNQQAVNIVFQQQSTSGGLPFNNKVSSLIPPLLTFQHSHPET